MGKLGFLFVAYLLIWVALAVYLFSLFARQRRIEREIELLRQDLQSRS